MIPYLSTTRTEAGHEALKFGDWQFPLSSGKVELLRHGEPFWEELEKHGVRTTIMRIPANFPPSGTATRELSGMGTPDLLGTYGTFSFYTTDPPVRRKQISGGKIYALRMRDGFVEGTLYGPDNPLRVEPEKIALDFALYPDPHEPVAKLVVGDEERVLDVGGWTDWVPVEFSLLPQDGLVPRVVGFVASPVTTVHGMCRFYLRKVRPEVELYASPINFDPEDPAAPISTPESYAAKLAEATGRFYTQGMPEDTKALTDEVLTRREFLEQAHIAAQEVIDQYGYVLKHFDDGLLFYYFGFTDQISHLMWRPMDPDHPAYDPVRDAPFRDVVEKQYEKADGVVGYTLEHMGPETLLVVMSDHGFTSWRRAFNLNTWLEKNGYLALKDPNLENDPGLFYNVDWTRTRAYGLGINGLYVNLRGREKDGIVAPEDRVPLLREIAAKLRATVDPTTGLPAVTEVGLSEDLYHDRGYLDVGPDMIVGYAKHMRCSNESALGGVPREVIVDNTDEWSGDHLMDHRTVPGILFTNRPLAKPASSLKNLAASILFEFGVEQFPVKK
jgi:predicted AlkP superfamily phosphohydrolase/phosphomutase